MKISSIDCAMNPQISTFLPEDSRQFSPNQSALTGSSLDNLFLLVAQVDGKSAIDEIFKKPSKSLCNFPKRAVQGSELSEEIVDDVFFDFWKDEKSQFKKHEDLM